MDAQLRPYAGALVNAIGTVLRKTSRQFIGAECRGTLIIFSPGVDARAPLDGGKDLARLKTEDPDRSPRAHRLALQRCALGLRGIFQHDQTMLFGEVADLIHVTWIAERVHRK